MRGTTGHQGLGARTTLEVHAVWRWGSSLLAGCMLAQGAAAGTAVVRPDGSGDFPTIRAAVTAAADGDTVALADGTFRGDGNRDIDYLGKAITIVSWSGDPEACVLDCQGSLSEPHRGFQFQTGEGASSILESVTIANGVAVPPPGGGRPADNGGAIYAATGTAPTITGCRFVNNHALYGGAVYASAATITGCWFSGNSADFGGGLWGVFTEIGRCVFTGNTAFELGGAVYGNAVTIDACTMVGNSAAHGGAMHNFTGVSSVQRTLVAFNEGGGAISCAFGTPMLSCCDLYGNVGGDWGGCVADQLGADGNVSADPLFCDAPNGDFTLAADSPCLPGNHPDGADCARIGSLDMGCEISPLHRASWSEVKARFQDRPPGSAAK